MPGDEPKPKMKASGQAKLRAHFLANVGRVMGQEELAPVAGIASWARRLRNLREEGMQILSHYDRADLRPGQYVLVDAELVPRPHSRIDKKTKALVRERDGFTCQACGAGAGDLDPDRPGRTIRLHVDHIDPDGPAEEWNLRTLCTPCNEGRSNLRLPRSSVNVLATVRRATRTDQLRVYEFLKRKFDHD